MRPASDITLLIGEVTTSSAGFASVDVDGQVLVDVPVDAGATLDVGASALLVKVDRRVVCLGEYVPAAEEGEGGGGAT